MPANRAAIDPAVAGRRRAPRPGCAVAAAVLLASSIAAADPVSSDPARDLAETRRALDETRALDERLRRDAAGLAAERAALKRRLVAVADDARRREAELSALRRRLAALAAERDERARALTRRRGALAEVLAALQRLAWRPPAALMALPARPNDVVRTVLLMRAARARLEGEARRVGAELAALGALRSDIARRRGRAAELSDSLARRRDQLAALIGRKAGLERRLRAKGDRARARAAALADKARDLSELIARLAAPPATRAPARPAQPGARSAPPRPGPRPGAAAIRLPARGRIVRRFGETGDSGEPAKGVSIATGDAAEVVAPEAGAVVFAGPFRSYGKLLILRHGDGHHALLAGLARIDAGVGEDVLAGEPVGVVGPSAVGVPTLYFELRRYGRAIDPLPWLAATDGKVSG